MSSTLAEQQLQSTICVHRMHSGTALNIGHLGFGSAQNPNTHIHPGYTCETEENRLEVYFFRLSEARAVTRPV